MRGDGEKTKYLLLYWPKIGFKSSVLASYQSFEYQQRIGW